MPAFQFTRQLALPFPRQEIELGVTAKLGILPFRTDPALLLQTMKGRVERALLHGKNLPGKDLDAFGDPPSMERVAGEGLQDEQVQCALEKIGWLRHASGYHT